MPKHGACNLGSINLSEFVCNPFTTKAYFNTEDFVKAVHIAVRALDDVLDENLNNHPLIEQRKMAKNYRNIGLGIMGLHDALIKLGMTYGSIKSVDWVDHIMSLMFRASVIASSELAEEKGCYPMYNENFLKSDILLDHFTEDELNQLGITEYGIRNCSLLSIAPTGSLGTMLNISTGCEPLFALYYNRKTESLNNGEDKYYKVYSGVVKEYVDKCGEDLPEYFVCSGDIDWRDRVYMQAVLQDHVDTAISSTINLPNEATLEEIEQLYLYAWESGLKGVTIFRDGCKRTGILTTDTSETTEETKELKRGEIVACSNDLIGKKRKLMSGCGSLHVLAYFDHQGNMQEVYLAKGSTGGCNNFMVGLSRTISLLCRAGVSVQDIKDQLDSTGSCPSYAVRSATKRDTSKGSCCPMAVGNALVDMWKEVQEELNNTAEQVKSSEKNIEKCQKNTEKSIEKCPVCGEELIHVGGCIQCTSCAWSKCE